ncbi:MAG: hypothetical protein M3367_12575 [Acidobacteriota bacterium]|nr:hypothetical protein [Acidobacteriota bacterium]
MGQIIIELPLEVSRIYQIKNKEFATEVLASLEKSARQMENPPAELIEYLEDLEDIISAREALREAEEKGTKSWEEIKAELKE